MTNFFVNPSSLKAMKGESGESGIRTLDTIAGITVFETAPFGHSGNSPGSVKIKKPNFAKASLGESGERGIRTPGPFGSTVFKTAAIDRSAISPAQK